MDCDGEHGWVIAALSTLGTGIVGIVAWLIRHENDDKQAHERIAKLEQRAEDNESL